MLLSLLLSVCIIIFFLARAFQCFFFLFQSLNPWLAGPYRHFRLLPPPPLPRHRPCWSDDGRARQSETTAKRKKRINLVVNLNRRYRLYIWQWLRWTAKTCLTIRFLMAGKVCRHFFFLLFFFCRTALGIVLFCFCCHYRPVMASWCGASSILFMTPGLRLSSVF